MRVRFRSDLTLEEVTEIVETRAPEFEALAGLKQKRYFQDLATGEYAGLYIWRTPDPLKTFRDSELRATTAQAYQAQREPDIEVYRVFKVLRDANA